ncbi:hypothetical protein BDP27DRAFT_1315672 [Rhodocollybia butyracea]|uniref:Uncharacterized protein n=1 Tax=Rhodocollybia butyracea TaxID=206335 RepID=A0A9P5Q4C5_9AGAR|nr:hypothetical protein BDP27DRAFT_1315672 [Rhodocollybia butyracea]
MPTLRPDNPDEITLYKSNMRSKIRTSEDIHKLIREKYTDLPVPIPETGLSTVHPLLAFPSTISRTTLTPIVTVPALAIPSNIFSPAPLLVTPTTLNLVSSTHATTPTTPTLKSSPVSSSSQVLSSPNTAAQSSSISHKLPVTIIAVLAVGSAVFLLGIFIIVKACTRPTHRARPKPSLPILDEAFCDDDLYSVTKLDSPIFGGKEQMSQNDSGLPTWTWTQYADARTETVPPLLYSTSDHKGSYNADGALHALHPISSDVGANDFLFPRPPPSQSVPTTLVSHFGMPNVLTTAASRFSIARSLSVYPASPVEKNYTADGHPIIQRSSKIALRRSDSRSSSDSLAYDATELKSPQFLAHFQTEAPTAPVGRTRIKSSYYTPGSYPRMSSLPSSTSMKSSKTKTEDVVEFNIQELPPIQRTDSRKARDTKALTSALGIASPTMETIPLSPAQTLYPDDSLSVVDMKRLPSQKHQHKPAAAVAMSTVDTSTALGSLMLMGFGTTDRSLSSLATVPLHDKPPRVPSPPPMLSLAQMGLENANPEAFVNYRSPTYSIFGLYGDSDRRSMHSKPG